MLSIKPYLVYNFAIWIVITIFRNSASVTYFIGPLIPWTVWSNSWLSPQNAQGSEIHRLTFEDAFWRPSTHWKLCRLWDLEA